MRYIFILFCNPRAFSFTKVFYDLGTRWIMMLFERGGVLKGVVQNSKVTVSNGTRTLEGSVLTLLV